MAQKRKNKMNNVKGEVYYSSTAVRRTNRRVWLMLPGVFVAVFLFTFLVAKFKDNNTADAANLGAFDPGYIISDYQMSNYNSMSEADIQNFLKQKGNCNDTRTYLADYYTNYSYHIKDGHFVCLADETFGDGTAYGNGAPNGASAAHIIWQAAQDYRINPQVIIVLLQKEQGLITDSWPNNRQYRSATGYGCPDTAACDSKYYGFKNQVRQAAAMFRTVLDGGWTNYPLGSNYIQYNPDSSCGGSWVNIRSLATSALYRYTPYQPNTSALAAGYGSGDSCGAYGNRNFYLYFEDWFGGITMSRSQDDIINERIRNTFDTSFDYSGTYNMVYSGDYNRNIGVEGDNVEIVRNSGICWKIEKIDDYYIIRNVATGKVLDVSGASFSNKTNVWQYELNKTCAQRWSFVENKDGTVTIHNACYPQYVLDLQGGDTNIQIYKKTDYENDHQKWVLRPSNLVNIKNGAYYIHANDTSKYVATRNNASTVGANVQADIHENTDFSRIWNITKVDGKDYYVIENRTSGKVLGVKKSSMTNKANISLQEKKDDIAYYWYIESYSGGGYYIRSAYNFRYVLDLQDGDKNIQIYAKVAKNTHQRWRIEKVDDSDYSGTYNMVYSGDYNRNIGVEGDNVEIVRNSGIRWKIEKIDDYYIIRNVATGKVLDVSGASFSNKTNVWQYELNKTCAQRWSFVENKDGTVTIHNACYPQYVLDLQGGDTNIQIYKKTDYENNHQKWVLKEINNKDYTGVYNIGYSKNQNKVVGAVDGNNVTVNSKSRDNTQQWKIEKIEKIDDYYIIRNVATGKVLDVSGASFSNKTNVWQYELNKTCAQRWSFVENKDGTVTIHNACYPQYVLDLQGGDTNIQIYKKTDYENNHQKWVLKEI